MGEGKKLALLTFKLITKIAGTLVIIGGLFILFGAGVIWCLNTVFELGLTYTFANMFAVSVLSNILIDFRIVVPRKMLSFQTVQKLK